MNRQQNALLLSIYLVMLMIPLLTISAKAQEAFTAFEEVPQPPAPDYSKLANWASHPLKKDLADKIPRPLRRDTTQLRDSIDVFFLHPTIFTKKPKDEYAWNAALTDRKLNRSVDKSTIKMQASIFNQAGRLFAPRYRQAHIRSFFAPDIKEGHKALALAYQDVKKAFLYYMENYNNGRPILFVGHSQGGRHLKKLLAELVDGKPLQHQLVAAYIVGWGVEKGSFEHIPLGQTPEQTGCFLSWRTYAKGFQPDWVKPNEVCVNPLHWRADSLYAPYESNKGAILFGFNRLFRNIFDAQVNGPVLWVGKPNIFLGKFLQRQDYHAGDLNLFYVNVRKNAILRARTFLNRD